jgi:HEAT repeat protein
MSVLDQLASKLGERNAVPNQHLAEKIAAEKNKAAVKELVENLSNKNRNIQSDCIKTLYEIGEREPSLIADYAKEFGSILTSKNPRLVWGAATALSSIASVNGKAIYSLLPAMLKAADDSGSVIARDHTVKALARLGSQKEYNKNCADLLVEQLMKAPVNQFPMYVEESMAVINDKNREAFVEVINARMNDDIEQESKRKRVEKVLKKLTK